MPSCLIKFDELAGGLHNMGARGSIKIALPRAIFDDLKLKLRGEISQGIYSEESFRIGDDFIALAVRTPEDRYYILNYEIHACDSTQGAMMQPAPRRVRSPSTSAGITFDTPMRLTSAAASTLDSRVALTGIHYSEPTSPPGTQNSESRGPEQVRQLRQRVDTLLQSREPSSDEPSPDEDNQ